MINPARLTYPAVDGRVAPRYGVAYEYTADRFDQVPGSFLFWGPYLDLDAGVYVINFVGQVEGRLSLEFIHDSGKMRIKRIDLDDFAAPACVVLVRTVRALEIRALKTPTLERLRLEGIRIQCVYRGEAPP